MHEAQSTQNRSTPVMNRQPKVCVVIPTHNRVMSLTECLQSVYASDYRNLEVCVVDDGSTDGTSTVVADRFPSVRLLNGDGNLWWSASMNLGIRASLDRGADYILPLNDDVKVEAGAVASLVECASVNAFAIVGSLIFDLHGSSVWCAGGRLTWPWPGETMISCRERPMQSFQGVWEVDWTPGMGTLIPRHFLLTYGVYDEKRMPQYLADADLTLRARKTEYRVLVTSCSVLFNRVESTGGIAIGRSRIRLNEAIEIFTSKRSPDYLKARLTFLFRHCPKRWLVLAILIRYTRLMIFALRRLSWI